MRFGLLGSLEVADDDGATVDLGGLQARTVLAVLLVAGGRPVTADTLLDVIWGDVPPASATGTLQSYVSRLRRILEPDRARGEDAKVLVWEPPGYRLVLDGHDVDHRRFEALADEGRARLHAGRVDEASEVLRSADAVWRGPALVEFADREFASGLAVRLEERRLAALEDRVAADLAGGRHGVLVGELAELVGRYPLREGLRAQQALALYRASRQAEALRALDDARRMLRDELGIDPGPALRDLESSILAHDPALSAPAEARPVITASAPSTAPSGEGLIGRDAELQQLVAALDETSSGATRAVIVEGEPGIGKTRVVEELGNEASRRGALVLWGRAFEGGAAPAFWPWLTPLRAMVAALPDVPLAPELTALLSPVEELSPLAGEQARFAMVEAVANLVATAAATRTVVLVFDDVQWADAGSLDLLSLVVARLSDVPLLVACTVRELEVGRNDAVVDALVALSRRPGTRRLQLRGLRADGTAELVARTTGRVVAPDLAALIHERAEGNPFFTTELARLLADEDADHLPTDVPSGVRDTVRRRLSLLPPETVDLLALGAVVGRDVDLNLLTRAAGAELGACVDALDPAVVQRLLVPVPEDPGTLRFTHALVREVLVDDISALKRARLHLQVADALEDTDDTAEIVAEHLWEAVPIGAGRRAADALENAAGVAVRRLAYRSARHLLERSVQLRRSIGSGHADLEAELRTLAGLVAVVAAAEGYPALIGSPMLARGKQLAELVGNRGHLRDLLWAEWAALDIACEVAAADPIAEELLQMAGETDDPMALVLGNTAYGIRCWHRGELRSSLEHLEAARDAAEAAGSVERALFDLDQQWLCRPFSVTLRDLVGELDDPERRYDEVVRRSPGNRFWEMLVMNFAASGAVATGDYARAERACRRGMAADPDGVSAFWSAALRTYLGVTMLLQGRLDEGFATFDAGYAVYAGAGHRTNVTSWLATRAQALAVAGRVDEATIALHEGEQMRTITLEEWSQPLLITARAAVEQASGAPDATVRATFEEALAVALAMGGGGIARRVRATAVSLGHAV